MKPKIVFVERKPSASVSIERVFRQIAKDLPPDKFDVEFQNVPYGNGILAIIKNLLFFRTRPADIYHITGDIHYISLVLPPNRTILTIHDLIFLRRRSGIRRFALKKLFLDWPLRRIKRVTVVSQAIKEEIINESGTQFESIDVIPNPLIDGFVAEPQKPFNTVCPIILHVGTAPNKNLDNLIEAAQGLPCKLKIIGRLGDKIVKSLERHSVAYENSSGLKEEHIVEEYRNADIVSFCSTYEGFGLPIIEAQAMRKPVVTSDLPPMSATAGDGAVLVDPYDIGSIRNGLRRLIDDEEYRQGMVESGIQNVKRFDGKALSGRYAAIYDRLLLKDQP
jgi:glycosyltransferase involved in cell wall biosynthesis